MIKYCYYDANGKPTSEVMTTAQWKAQWKGIKKLYTNAWIDSTKSVMFENGKFKAWWMEDNTRNDILKYSTYSEIKIRQTFMKTYNKNYKRALILIFGCKCCFDNWNIKYYDDQHEIINDDEDGLYISKIVDKIYNAGLYTDVDDVMHWHKQLENLFDELDELKLNKIKEERRLI